MEICLEQRDDSVENFEVHLYNMKASQEFGLRRNGRIVAAKHLVFDRGRSSSKKYVRTYDSRNFTVINGLMTILWKTWSLLQTSGLREVFVRSAKGLRMVYDRGKGELQLRLRKRSHGTV